MSCRAGQGGLRRRSADSCGNVGAADKKAPAAATDWLMAICEHHLRLISGETIRKRLPYHEIRLWAAEKAKQCNMQCEVCYACAFDPGDDLFTRVFRIVSCFEHGTFDITKDDYEDACRELVFHRRRHTTLEIPL